MVDKQILLKYYREMLLIRRFEEKAGQLYGMGLIAGFCHLYIGQEAVVVGVYNALDKADNTITAYRDHGHMLVAGTDPKVVMAELMGKGTGCSKGKGGSMHMFDLQNNFYGGHGIVGAQVPIGAGLAFASKYKGENKITATYMGDGAVHQGQVFEAFNMASMWKLPVLFIIENNEFAMGTSVLRHSCNDNLYEFAQPFKMYAKQTDGMDVINVQKETAKAVKYIREGNGPALLEFKTYRYRGHSMSDPAKYRTKEDLSVYKDGKDPINGVKDIILSKKFATEDNLKEIEKEIKNIVNESVEFSKESSEPSESELYTDVYTEGQ